MRAGLENSAILDEIDAVRVLDRRQAMRNGDGRPALRGLVERGLDNLL